MSKLVWHKNASTETWLYWTYQKNNWDSPFAQIMKVGTTFFVYTGCWCIDVGVSRRLSSVKRKAQKFWDAHCKEGGK